jgi:hypothetical protein
LNGLANLAYIYGVGGDTFFFDESLYLVGMSVDALFVERQTSTYNVKGLLRPIANEWPRNDGYPLTSRNVAILAVVKKLVGNRHDGSINVVCVV